MLWLLVIIPFVIYLVFALLLACFQSKFLFLPGKTIFMTPDEKGLEYENLFLDVDNGYSINAWFIPAENARGTVLMCHGNAGTMSHRIDTAEIFHSMELNVMFFDYCGYGRSTGKVSEKQTHLDAEAVWNYLVDKKNISQEKIIIIGRSMGGPIAAKLAKEHNSALCILESTFTSIPEMAKNRFPIFPTSFLVSIKYPTIEYVKDITSPILIVHSSDDEIIPYRMGENIFAMSNEPKYFLELSGGHNETYFECIDKYRGQLDETIRKYLL